MDNALISNETVSTGANWCYSAKASGPAMNISTEKENASGGSLIMAPPGFGIGPYKFTVKKAARDREKQLQLTRLMAFGRSLTGQGWS